MSLTADSNDTQVPIELTLTNEECGVTTGASPTVRIRRSESQDFLDFVDMTFKTSGWAQQTQVLIEGSPGFYSRPGGLDLTGITNLSPSTSLIFEYEFTDSGRTFVCHEAVTIAGGDIEQVISQLSVALDCLAGMKKHCENRLLLDVDAQELILFEDDGVTPCGRWPVKTKGGEPVVAQVGVQIERLANVL